jgi:glycosyltransferase involved in cell wall biosynthesis
MLRAAMSLDALRKHFRVHVLNLNVWSWGSGRPSFLLNRAASYVELPGAQGDVDTSTLLEKYFPGIEFVAIHTFKLIMARVAIGILASMKGARPYLVLDLDDDECTRSARMLNRMEQENDIQAVRQGRVDEAQLRMLEKMMAPRFNALCLAGVDDCAVVQARYPHVAVHHLPNAIGIPDNSERREVSLELKEAAKILFVGALYYAPNADGICYFVEEVFPIVLRFAKVPVTLCVVGADPLRRVTQLAQSASVTIHPNVPAVAPYYEEASLCIVPLRVGSGTRIKILEAFSYRRPVVSTHLGAEGLAVRDGEQLLLADEPEAMAQACAAILNDREMRDRLVGSAYDWVFQNHTVANVEAALESIYQPVLS